MKPNPIIFLALSALISFSGRSGANIIACKKLLTPSSQTLFDGFLELDNALKMHVKIEAPKTGRAKDWALMIHGMLDSHRAWDHIAPKLIQQKVGIIRMDLEGFGRTLDENHRRADGSYGQLPDVHFNKQLINLVHLIEKIKLQFGIRKPHLVGHSMGGGLALALAATQGAAEIIGKKVFIFSPYVHRLETWEAQKYFPFTSFYEVLFQGPLRERIEALTVDHITTPFMEGAYSSFFTELLDRREGGQAMSAVEKTQIIEAHTQTAISATQGLRDLNLLRRVSDLPEGVSVVHAAGTADQLIDYEMQEKLADKLAFHLPPEQYQGLIGLEDTGHMSTDEAPEALSRLITQELRR